jgi:hypothetical protein
MMLFDLRFTGIAGLSHPIANKLTIPGVVLQRTDL